MFNVIDQLEAGAKLKGILFFRGPVILAPEIPAGVFMSDNKTHTPTYELRSNRLFRPEAQHALRQSLNEAPPRAR